MAASQALARKLRCRSFASSFAQNNHCRIGSSLHRSECEYKYHFLISPHSICYTTDMSPSKGSKKILFVDTHAFVRRLESQGLTAKQAEAITTAVMEVLNDSIHNVSQTFASKPDMQKIEMVQESTLGKLKLEIQNAQEYKMSLIQRDIERIRTDVEKMRSDLRYEIDKVTSAQRLDINLERGRTRDDLAKQSAETTELTTKLDREIHALKTQVEAAKYEVIKYGIGTIVSLTALGLGLLRILM